jgi:hypothetical protein
VFADITYRALLLLLPATTGAPKKGHAPEGEPLFVEATFVPLGGPCPPLARPGCSSAALRRALALGGWPWHVFAGIRRPRALMATN